MTSYAPTACGSIGKSFSGEIETIEQLINLNGAVGEVGEESATFPHTNVDESPTPPRQAC